MRVGLFRRGIARGVYLAHRYDLEDTLERYFRTRTAELRQATLRGVYDRVHWRGILPTFSVLLEYLHARR